MMMICAQAVGTSSGHEIIYTAVSSSDTARINYKVRLLLHGSLQSLTSLKESKKSFGNLSLMSRPVYDSLRLANNLNHMLLQMMNPAKFHALNPLNEYFYECLLFVKLP